MSLFRLAAAGATAIALVSASASAAHAAPTVTRGMYGDRYCEYLVVKGTLPDLVADVWNTYTFNSCPQSRWATSDAKAIAAELGAVTVVLNGPRYWLMDRASIEIASDLGEVRRFPAGLTMRKIAAVEVPVRNGVAGNTPYNEVVVRRANTFVWSKKHKVHELVAPDGKRYVMQAYSRIVDAKLSLEDLPGVGARLKLPEGWRYRTRKLKRDLVVNTTRTGKAVIVQDDLQNTYQRIG